METNKRKETNKKLSNYYYEFYKQLNNKIETRAEEMAIARIEICGNAIKYGADVQEFKESLITLYLRQIENLRYIYDYHQIAKISEEFLMNISNGLNYETISLKKYLNYTLIFALENIAFYSGALQKIHNFMQSGLLTEEEIHYFKYRKAANMYAIGASQEAYDILLTLYRDTNKGLICGIKFCILLTSKISSVAEYLALYEDCKKYFVNALKLCKKYGYSEQLYTLYSMMSMAQYDIKYARPFMFKALKYFENNNNKKMIARCLHNLATDALYEAERKLNRMPKDSLKNHIFWKESEKQITTSIDIFNCFGSNDVIYPYNTYAIIQFIFNNNVHEAIKYAEKALVYCPDHFARATFLMLLYNLHMNTDASNKFKISEQYLSDFNNEITKENISFFQVYKFITNGLHALLQKKYSLSIGLFEECFNIKNIENKHLLFVARMLQQISEEHGQYTPSAEIKKACEIKTFPLIYKFIEKRVFLGTLRFWE